MDAEQFPTRIPLAAREQPTEQLIELFLSSLSSVPIRLPTTFPSTTLAAAASNNRGIFIPNPTACLLQILLYRSFLFFTFSFRPKFSLSLSLFFFLFFPLFPNFRLTLNQWTYNWRFIYIYEFEIFTQYYSIDGRSCFCIKIFLSLNLSNLYQQPWLFSCSIKLIDNSRKLSWKRCFFDKCVGHRKRAQFFPFFDNYSCRTIKITLLLNFFVSNYYLKF